MGRGVVLIGDEAVCTRYLSVKLRATGTGNEVAHRYLPTKDDVGTHDHRSGEPKKSTRSLTDE